MRSLFSLKTDECDWTEESGLSVELQRNVKTFYRCRVFSALPSFLSVLWFHPVPVLLPGVLLTHVVLHFLSLPSCCWLSVSLRSSAETDLVFTTQSPLAVVLSRVWAESSSCRKYPAKYGFMFKLQEVRLIYPSWNLNSLWSGYLTCKIRWISPLQAQTSSLTASFCI